MIFNIFHFPLILLSLLFRWNQLRHYYFITSFSSSFICLLTSQTRTSVWKQAFKTRASAWKQTFKTRTPAWQQTFKTRTATWRQTFKTKTLAWKQTIKTRIPGWKQTFKTRTPARNQRLVCCVGRPSQSSCTPANLGLAEKNEITIIMLDHSYVNRINKDSVGGISRQKLVRWKTS